MGKQLSFGIGSLYSGKQKNSSLEQHISSKKEQKPKRKNQREQLVSRLLPKVEKELKLKSLTLEDNTQEKKLSKVNTLKEDTAEAEAPEKNLPDKEALFDNLISVEELAVIFRLAPQTIRKWVSYGKIPHVRIGRRYFFQKRSLEKWLNQKEEPLWE
ncbi:MAG: helix-turn-helix domain-containing protein [Oligoflexia bacterium]|nr:helix-turn-helix domain-containing protein [Oligoflexia bacterium]